MANKGSKEERKIPSWQQQSSQIPVTDSQSDSSSEEYKTVHEGRSTAGQTDSAAPANESSESEFSVKEVRKFLSDPGVVNAPEEQKRAFLEAKGVQRQAIDKILSELSVEGKSNINVDLDVEEFKAQKSTQKQGNADTGSAPPIVTYPEFLVKPQKPPPLVTVGRLLNTAYIVGSLATVFYGASEYLIKPMVANLTGARHDFVAHSDEHIQRLNKRLTQVVSKVPAPKSVALHSDADPDDESIVSDPTELFHRDIGVQTSPSLSRRSSSDSSSANLPDLSKDVIEKQGERLSIMRSHLNEILDSEVANRDSNGVLETSVAELRDYLNGLTFAPPPTVEYGVWQPEGKSQKDKNDATTALRSEIRGVKGMLLSAKRFPGAAPTRVGA